MNGIHASILLGFAFTCHRGPGRVVAISAAVQMQPSHCDQANDAKGPVRSSHDCCVYCSVAGRDVLTRLIVVVADFILAPTPSVVATAYYQTDTRNPVPLGLATSWSSRAPPPIS